MLDRLLAKGQVSPQQVAQIGDRLVRFFRSAARGPSVARYGTAEAVEALLLGNLRECRPFLGRLLADAEYGRLESAYRQFVTLHEPLLARRVRQRRIIDGHGDLRCENICLPAAPRERPRGAAQAGLSRGPVIFDCVEFQPAFRCADVVNDFAFLVMDLEVRGRRDLARVLVKRYRWGMRDGDFERLLPVYKCHRALVRAKVRALAWQQHPRTPQGQRLLRLARRHVRLALRYAREFAPPRLLVVGGLIGTGKSTLARQLAQALGAVWLRTDQIRLREFGGLRRRGQGFEEGLYTPRVSTLVYQRLIERAERLVRAGHSVVCDGTFSKAAGREALRRIARRHGASFHFFECVVPRAVALRRLARRWESRSDVSEARPEHYERLRAGYEPLRSWPRKDWTRLSDNRPPRQTLHAALAVMGVWSVSSRSLTRRERRAKIVCNTMS
jgi:hypothetical protein